MDAFQSFAAGFQPEHHVMVAHNGKEALEALKVGAFDLVFMDVQMPQIGGVEDPETIFARVANDSVEALTIAE